MKPLCVLLVEDEFLIRDVARFILENAGHEVLAAEHGQQACDHVDQNPSRFSCLVTDYHMPGDINGGHVIEYMRPVYPSIPMILASAFPHVTTQEWRARYGVELVLKPYDPDELARMVGRLLHKPTAETT